MNEQEMLIVCYLLGALGGAIGARQAGAAPWKGAVIVLTSSLISGLIFSFLNVENYLLSIASSIVLAGIVGGMLKLGSRQIGLCLMGAILFFAIGSAIYSSFAK